MLIARELVRMEQCDLADDLRNQILATLKTVCVAHFTLLNVKDAALRGERLAYDLIRDADGLGGAGASITGNIVPFERPLM